MRLKEAFRGNRGWGLSLSLSFQNYPSPASEKLIGTCIQNPSVPTGNTFNVSRTCKGPLLNYNTSKQALEIIGVLVTAPKPHKCSFSRCLPKAPLHIQTHAVNTCGGWSQVGWPGSVPQATAIATRESHVCLSSPVTLKPEHWSECFPMCLRVTPAMPAGSMCNHT